MKKWLFAGLLTLGLTGGAWAAGLFPGFTAGTAPFTGTEAVPADTGLANGASPQTETITLDQIKNYVFGNGGTAAKTAPATGTSAAGAITLNADRGIITTESLTTAAGADYTLTLTDSDIIAGSEVLVQVANGTNTLFPVTIDTIVPSAGQAVIKLRNSNAGALNGTLKLSFLVVN